MRLASFLLLSGLAAAPLAAHAQRGASVAAPRFDVASIKLVQFPNESFFRGYLSAGGTCGLSGVNRSGNRVAIRAAAVCSLIRAAYDVENYQVEGIPPELTKGEALNFFAIDARSESGTTPSMDESRLMLRTMLAERFRLTFHREPREVRVYALVPAKGRPNVGGPGARPCPSAAGSISSPGRIVSCNQGLAMARVAQMLSRVTDRPVIDKTGLTGTRTFELHWLPEGEAPQPDSPPTLFTALQEQLGLKLEPQRAMVDTIVVDHVERPSPN